MCPTPLPSPQSGDFVRVERIPELHVYLRTRQDPTRIIFSPERADVFGCGCGEERACQLEYAIIQFVATPRRIPDERSARLAATVDEVAADAQTILILQSTGDEARHRNLGGSG